MLNFLPPEPIKDLANRWRSIVAGILLLLVFLLFAWSYFKTVDKKIAELPNTVQTLSVRVVSGITGKTGGDIVVEPPAQFKLLLPELKGEMLTGDKFSALNVIVKDQKTGAVLFKKNEYEKRPIASITKLMSALVILEKNPDWTTTTKVTGDDVEDTHMYAGDTYTLEELWNSALIGSSNKAIITLADVLGLSREKFVARMNEKAKELGMADSVFTDPSGLDNSNISSASDLAILINEVMRWPKIKDTLNKKEFTIYSAERKKQHHMWNTDWLLLGWIPNQFTDFRGGKTGYIPASGYNFVMQVGNESGQVLNVVIMGSSSNEARFNEAKEVAEWTFKSYEWPS